MQQSVQDKERVESMEDLYFNIFGNVDDSITIGNMEMLEEQGFEFYYSEHNADVKVFKNGKFVKNFGIYYKDDSPDQEDFAEEILKLFD